jgi:acyl carrier protein
LELNKENLVKELRDLIPDVLSNEDEDIDITDLGDDEPLSFQDLGIDSIDVLELAVAIERKYKVKIGDAEKAKEAFKSLNSLADFIIENQNS